MNLPGINLERVLVNQNITSETQMYSVIERLTEWTGRFAAGTSPVGANGSPSLAASLKLTEYAGYMQRQGTTLAFEGGSST